MNWIRINTVPGYDVLIGNGLLEKAGEYIAEIQDARSRRVLIVTDDNVAPLWLDKLKESLEKAEVKCEVHIIKNGEQSKNIDNYIEIIHTLEHKNFCRANAVVALGGGVVGDLAGFAAATFQRGMKFVQIPTTVLAAVDSSVGGKTGVNLDTGKNLLGTFYQPSLVLCDPETFKTLPAEVVRDGCGEILKYGILANARLFEDVSDAQGNVNSIDEDIIAKCVSIKKYYVENDEHDRGVRQYLNLGHTIGHAVEYCSRYTITHGAAVAMGMVVATRIALNMCVCEADCPIDVLEGIRSVGFDISCKYTAAELMEAIMHDKKRLGSVITMILPKRVGECTTHTFTCEELERVLTEVLG